MAEFDAVRHDPAEKFRCDTKPLGPEGRLWSAAGLYVKRATESCQLDYPVGQVVRFESIFMVPARYADQLIGIALPNYATAARTTVLTPPGS